MKILLVTPAAPRSRAGNRATATRWAGLARQLGHRIEIVTSDSARALNPAGVDAVIALHAWRSADAIQAAAQGWPERALIVALTGTDIYRFQHSDAATTLASMRAAHTLVGLHDDVGADIPACFADKLVIVHQSATPLPASYRGPVRTRFDILVAGHLREEKDSLRAAYAARALPADSRIHVINAGRAHNDEWAAAARSEAETNPRFEWRGEIAHSRVRRLMAASRVMVMSSVMEGGANVVSEACVARLPVIAADISGNRGLLGADYPGYYPARDTAALRALLQRAESDPAFVDTLRRHCAALAPRFTPAAERNALARALAQE